MSATTPDQNIMEALATAEDRGYVDCGHDDIWMESGSCMACEPAWRTPEEAEAFLDQSPDVYGRNPL